MRSRITSLPFKLSTQASNDQVRSRCRELLVDYKELQHQLQRFQSKHSQISRTNHLRLILLRFLRLKTDVVMDQSYHHREMHDFVVKTSTYGVKVLLEWWSVLIEDLMGHGLTISSVDRSVYLECVTRIITRKEWTLLDDTAVYSAQLQDTLEMCFTRLLAMKTISLPTSAFIGKIFAYAYFQVDGFAHVLLFALFVKNFSVQQVLRELPTLKRHTGTWSNSLLKLVNYTGDYNLSSDQPLDRRMARQNCIHAPERTRFGDFTINMRDTSWVKRWADYESDVFCSFLRHYFTLCSQEEELFQCPGFIILYAHIKDVFNYSCMSIVKFRQQPSENSNKALAMDAIYASSIQGSDKNNFPKFIRKLPIIPYFALVRSIVHECGEKEAQQATQLIEHLLISKAKTVQAHRSLHCEVVYELLIEYMVHLQHDSQKNIRDLNWNFWISGLVRMLDTGYLMSQARAIAYLFNIWSMLPLDFIVKDTEGFTSESWISNPDLTLIYNISSFLISKPVWEMLFGHWDPLVRYFYMRLVVFKVIGSSSDNYGSYLNSKKSIKANLNATFELFQCYAKHHKPSSLSLLDLAPSNPIPNKKFIITSMDPKSLTSTYVDLLETSDNSRTGSMSSSTSSSTLLLPSSRKVYAYDVFDDAIYSSSLGSGTSTPLAEKSMRSVSNPGSPANKSRSPSSASLGRLPILSSALSFLKKVGSPQETMQQTPPMSLSPDYEDARSSRTSPYLTTNVSLSSQGSSRSTSFLKRSPSSLSSPCSSVSEMSDEEFDGLLEPPKIPSYRSASSSTSRSSSASSSTSGLSQTTSMDALPSPPELLTKVPELKKYRLKFHLTTAHSSPNQQLHIAKSQGQVFFSGFAECKPSRPLLPFEGPRIGLLHDQSYGPQDSDEDEDGILMLPRTTLRNIDSDLMFKDVKNYMLLGKFLNEWQSTVHEYEKFTEITQEPDNEDESFVDPLLSFGGPSFAKFK